MGDADARARHQLADACRAGVNGLHAVVEIIHLPAARQLLADGLGHDALVIFQHIGFDGLALKGRLLDRTHIPYAGKRHIQCARNGRGRQRQHVHADEVFFQLFLVLYAETLLLVNDDQPQILELHVIRKQPVGAHHNVHGAVLQAAQRFFLLLGAAVAAEQPDAYGEGLHARNGGIKMLPRQNGRGRQNRALLAAHHALERRAQGDFGLADADVAAQQAVHRVGLLHVMLDVGGAGQLVGGLVVGKALFKIPLPGVVIGEGVALCLLAAGVQLDQLLGHRFGGCLDPLAGLDPVAAAKAAQFYVVAVAGRGIARKQIKLGDRHIQNVLFVVLDAQVVFGDALHGHALNARVPTDAVVLVYDQIALGDFAQAVQGVLAALFLLLHAAHAEGAGGDDGIFGKRQAAACAQLARQYLHQPGGGRGGRIGGDLQAMGAQAVGKTGGGARGARHHGNGGPAAAQRVQVLQQGSHLAGPGGQGVGGCVDHGFQGNIRHTAHKVFGADGGVSPRLRPQPGGVGVQLAQPGGQNTVLQQGSLFLAAAEIRRALRLL